MLPSDVMSWEIGRSGEPVWVGPRSVRLFVRAHRVQAGLSLLWSFWFAYLGWSNWDAISQWTAITLGVITGAVGWVGLMFGFSRGWLADGD